MEALERLKTAFQKDGTVTAGNASGINDGAAAIVMMSTAEAEKRGLVPIAKIITHSTNSQEPKWFTTTPTKALEKALQKAQVKKEEVDFWELNEAFSVVGIANTKNLKINPDKININGGIAKIELKDD